MRNGEGKNVIKSSSRKKRYQNEWKNFAMCFKSMLGGVSTEIRSRQLFWDGFKFIAQPKILRFKVCGIKLTSCTENCWPARKRECLQRTTFLSWILRNFHARKQRAFDVLLIALNFICMLKYLNDFYVCAFFYHLF